MIVYGSAVSDSRRDDGGRQLTKVDDSLRQLSDEC